MCGISGIFDAAGRPVERALLETVGRAQTHRGPDHFGVFHEDSIGLANNRLSLLDLSSAGNQPFVDDAHVLVYNGEIYNFRELRRSLEAEVEFRSDSDTEVLFHLLARRGVAATLKAVRGMFAFAFFERRARRLILARDRVGIKPLFFARRGSTLFFASEMKALLPALEPKVEPIRALYSALGILEKARKKTIFNEVEQVEPGTFLSFSSAGLEIEDYFRLADLIDEHRFRELDARAPAAIVDELGTLFGRSIESMRVADAPLGAFVSGGIDSSLIAAFASRPPGARAQNLELFTADVQGRLSETPDARLLAHHLGRTLHESAFRPEDFLRDWARCTWHYESPIVVHANAVPFAGVARLAHDSGVKAVLTGEGSDELFLGYPPLLTARYRPLLELPYRLIDALYSRLPGLRNYLRRDVEISQFGNLELVAQGFERQILRHEGLEKLDFLPEKQRRHHWLTLQMLNESLVSLLWRNDRMGMAASIEARFPFLDEDILAFAINLPIRFKIGRSRHFHNFKHPFLVDKWVVRRLAEPLLPRRLVHKPKNGFPVFGLRHLRIDQGFFADGFWQSLLGFRDQELAAMVRESSPYVIAKYAAVDLWGRLFVKRQSIAELDEHVARFARLETT